MSRMASFLEARYNEQLACAEISHQLSCSVMRYRDVSCDCGLPDQIQREAQAAKDLLALLLHRLHTNVQDRAFVLLATPFADHSDYPQLHLEEQR